MSGHLLIALSHFEKSNNTPLLLPTRLLEVQTESILTKCLLSLVVQLVLQFHLFREISRDSNSALRRHQ